MTGRLGTDEHFLLFVLLGVIINKTAATITPFKSIKVYIKKKKAFP